MPKLSNPFALPLRDYDLNPYVHPTILREGYAGHVIGLDGTDYVDFLSSWGTNLLGYGYLPVAQAAAAQVGRFAAVGVPYPGFNDLIRLLQDTLPGAEAVRFGKNGSDACAGAVRLARAVTGRETILYRGYHGFHDWYMASTDCAGIPACLHKTLAPIPDLRPSVIDERLRESPDGVAALILNPLVGPIPTADEIREVIDVVHRHGALVIFDEMMSGFRVAVGGMQEVWGVGADLACYGKSIANGLPLAALTGRTELMARLPETYYGMTFEGEAVSIAAAEATVREVKRLDVVGALYDKGRAIRAGYERLAAEYGVRTHLGGFEPCLHLEFEDQAPLMRRELLWLTIQELVRDGIFTLGSFVLCYSHRDEDLGRLLRSMRRAMEVVRRALDRGSVEGLLDPRIVHAMRAIHAPANWRRVADARAAAPPPTSPQRRGPETGPTAPLPAEEATVGYRAWWNRFAGSTEEAISAVYGALDERDFEDRGIHGDANTLGAAQLVEIAGLDQRSRVLEIGCGIARVGRALAPHVGEWHGIDVSPSLLQLARARTADRGNMTFHETLGSALAGIDDESMDFVYATATLSYIDGEDVFEYLVEARRVLRPNALFYADFWNLGHPDAFRIWRHDVVRHNRGDAKSLGRLRCTTAQALRMSLEETGFEIVHLAEERLLRVLARKSEVRVHHPDDGLAPFGYVDWPRNTATVTGDVTVAGWALDAVVAVEVAIDGRAAAHGTCGVERADLAPLFPRYLGARGAGFLVTVPASTFASGHREVEVEAVDVHDRRTTLTGAHLGIRWQPQIDATERVDAVRTPARNAHPNSEGGDSR